MDEIWLIKHINMQCHLKVGETGEVNYLIISLKTVVLWVFFSLCSLVVFALWSDFFGFFR